MRCKRWWRCASGPCSPARECCGPEERGKPGAAAVEEGGRKIELTEEQKTEYFRRSYTAVDGLWFMKVEERMGFEAALQIDEAVWEILPKIQARALKAMMDLPAGLAGLEQALSARLALEGFDFEIERHDESLMVMVRSCPWHQIMIKSGRGSLSERVSDVICRVENETWAREFSEPDGEIGFERETRICQGEGMCRLWFGKKEARAQR